MCPLCALWKDVHAQPLMSGKRCPTSSRAEYLHKLGFFCIGDLSFLSCLFTFQSFFNLYDIYFSSLGYKSSIACVLSCVQLFANPWTVAHQALLSRFPRQEYWSGLPFPSPGDLPYPVIKPASPALAGGFFTTEPHSCSSFDPQELFQRLWHLQFFKLQ